MSLWVQGFQKNLIFLAHKRQKSPPRDVLGEHSEGIRYICLENQKGSSSGATDLRGAAFAAEAPTSSPSP